MDDVVEEGDVGEGLEETFVGDHRCVHFVFELVEDDARAGEALGFDGCDGKEYVIEGTEPVCSDEDDRQIEFLGKVRDEVIFGDRYFPAASSFDEDGVVFSCEFAVG